MNFTLKQTKIEDLGMGLHEDGKIMRSYKAHYKGDCMELVVDFFGEKVLIPKSVNLQFKDIQEQLKKERLNKK